MKSDTLSISFVQTHLHWENKSQNLKQFEQYFSQLQSPTDLILLPELFSSAFSMNTHKLAEPMGGETTQWMLEQAKKHHTHIGGSIIIQENNHYFNRFLIVSENGVEAQYDKSHLFRMGEEHQHFTKGSKKIIFKLKGWRLLLQVCYDLRFPVFSRNQTTQEQTEYDVLLYVANWPERRTYAWDTLLRARAIENQSFCVGVNRSGLDGNQINHLGHSAAIDPWGNYLIAPILTDGIYTSVLDSKILDKIKTHFPAYLDSDSFQIK